MRNSKTIRICWLALTGAVVATVCDGFHVHTQTLSYSNPFLFGQAGYVFPGFMLAFFVMGQAYSFLADRLPPWITRRQSTTHGTVRELTEAATAFVLVYLLSGFGNDQPVLLSLIFYSTFLVRLVFSYDRGWLLVLSVLMAFGGMAVEGSVAALGWMSYRHVDVFHVPSWLGGVYLHGAFALREGMRCLVYPSPPAIKAASAQCEPPQ